MVVRSEERARAVDVDEVLEGGVGDGKAVERRGTTSELVEKDLREIERKSARRAGRAERDVNAPDSAPSPC